MRLGDLDKLVLSLMDVSLSSVDEDTILGLIDRVQVVDAVQVVRCKDCKYSRVRNEQEVRYLAAGVLICESGDADDDGWNPVWPDHFCSYGEQKEDN